MILPIVTYGDPVLRHKGESIAPDYEGLTQLIEDMLETMRQEQGIGLAAPQIGRALQLAVVDISASEDRSSRMFLGDQAVDYREKMPLILMNPQVKLLNEPVTELEGCLSFPEVFGKVPRPEAIEVSARQPDGSLLQCRCHGLLSRVVQHETDHLNGILFIDRMVRDEKHKLLTEYREARERSASS